MSVTDGEINEILEWAYAPRNYEGTLSDIVLRLLDEVTSYRRQEKDRLREDRNETKDMTERIDHAGAARRVMAHIPEATLTGNDEAIAWAQVQATLTLVEQQRLANLIALASTLGESDWGMDVLAAEAAASLVRFVPHSPDDEHPEIVPEVASALGINDDKETNDD